MKILLTGGLGFIGTNLASRLLDDGREVTILDNFDPFYPRAMKERNLALLRAKHTFRFIEADILDNQAMDGQLASFDAIIHLAAKAGVQPSLRDPRAYQSVNVMGTQNMLDLAKRLNVPQFIFASSSSVYGVNPRTPWSEEDNVLLPISPYAATKVSCELMGHVYSRLYGLRFIALRLFTVYGPLQRPDLAIRKFAGLMLQGQPIPMFGDGRSSRDYTFVDDIARGFDASLHYNGSLYEIVNLGNSHPVTLLELIRQLERVLGIEARIEKKPDQPGDVPATWADTRKAERLLGWHAQVGLKEGMDRFAAWLLQNDSQEYAGAAHGAITPETP